MTETITKEIKVGSRYYAIALAVDPTPQGRAKVALEIAQWERETKAKAGVQEK